ncbi:hypothetical protein, partial [Streptomyces sp. NPDC056132]
EVHTETALTPPRCRSLLRRMYDLFLSGPAAVIGDRELDTLAPGDVATIWRTTVEKRGVVTANRTKAGLSLVLNCGRLWGMMAIANPCAGVRRKKETGRRDALIDDELYAAVYAAPYQPLCNAMDLANLCVQRPSDILRMQRANIVRASSSAHKRLEHCQRTDYGRPRGAV